MRRPRAAIVVFLGLVPACGGGGGGQPPWFTLESSARYDLVPLTNGGKVNTVCLAVVDVDDDGVHDLAGVTGTCPYTSGPTTDYFLPHVVTYVGLGGGDFAADWTVGWPPYEYDHRWAAAGDFDEDGLLDLAVSDALEEGVLAILLDESQPSLAWVPQEPSFVGGEPSRIVAGDWDDDGHLDVAVLVPGAERVRVRYGNGDGTFSVTTNPKDVPLATGSDPRDLVAADVDGDDDLDLLTADHGADQVSVFLNHGRLGFGPGTPVPLAGGPEAIVAALLTADAHLDLAVTCSSAVKVAIFEGTGTGDFTTLAPITLPWGAAPSDVVALDVDGDGDLDLAYLLGFPRGVGLRRNDGGGVFSDPGTAPLSLAGHTLLQLETADVTGDGLPDLLVQIRNGAIQATQVFANVAPQAP